MGRRRRRRGFGQLADVAPAGLGLPATRTRELRLCLAWRRVAGAAVAARAPVVAVRRGVLEIRRPDDRWFATLEPMLPDLAAQLAAEEPELGIARFRVRAAGERGAPARPLGTARDEPPRPPARGGRPPSAAQPASSIERVRALYLARGSQKP